MSSALDALCRKGLSILFKRDLMAMFDFEADYRKDYYGKTNETRGIAAADHV